MDAVITKAGPVLPTGRQLSLRAGDYRAVVTEVGATLRLLEHRAAGTARPLVLGFGEDEPSRAGAGQVLAPWPNRVGGGRYRYAGVQHQLDLSEPGRSNAIHGLVRWAAWRVEEHTGDSARLSYRLHPHPGYPHTLDITAKYSLSSAGLEARVSARNVGGSPAPYGFAAHPYLVPGVPGAAGAIDRWTLHLPARRRMSVDGGLIPVGIEDVDGSPYDFRSARLLGATPLDTSFGGLQRERDGIGRVRLSEPGGGAVTLWMDRGLEWVHVFTADALPGAWRRGGVAIEPMSCPPDAFNSGMDLIHLVSDETVVHRWGIHAG